MESGVYIGLCYLQFHTHIADASSDDFSQLQFACSAISLQVVNFLLPEEYTISSLTFCNWLFTAASLPAAAHKGVAMLLQYVFASVSVENLVIVLPKMVSTTSAATRMTMAVTIITRVWDIPFIMFNLWCPGFIKYACFSGLSD